MFIFENQWLGNATQGTSHLGIGASGIYGGPATLRPTSNTFSKVGISASNVIANDPTGIIKTCRYILHFGDYQSAQAIQLVWDGPINSDLYAEFDRALTAPNRPDYIFVQGLDSRGLVVCQSGNYAIIHKAFCYASTSGNNVDFNIYGDLPAGWTVEISDAAEHTFRTYINGNRVGTDILWEKVGFTYTSDAGKTLPVTLIIRDGSGNVLGSAVLAANFTNYWVF